MSVFAELQAGMITKMRKEAGAYCSRPGGNRYVDVGLDFGTSSTKAVYRREDSGESGAVVFGEAEGEYTRHCLPSVGAYWRGNLLFGAAAERVLKGGFGLRRMKMLVAGRADEKFCDPGTQQAYNSYVRSRGCTARQLDPLRVAALFLGYAMHRCHLHIAETLHDNCVCGFKISIPMEYQAEDALSAVYTDQLTAQAECIYREVWYGERIKADELADRELKNRYVAVWPELQAAIASYMQHPGRTLGLHLIVDIGAGTLDQGITLIERPLRNGPVNASWLATRVLPYNNHEGKLVFDSIRAGYAATFGRAYSNPHWRRLSSDRSEQFERIRFFVTGGGSLRAENLQALKERCDHLQDVNMHLVPRPLPKPDDLRDVTTDEYRRLAVAYGLVRDDIGRYNLLHNLRHIEYEPLLTKAERQPYVGKEQT